MEGLLVEMKSLWVLCLYWACNNAFEKMKFRPCPPEMSTVGVQAQRKTGLSDCGQAHWHVIDFVLPHCDTEQILPGPPHVTYTFIFLWNCGITHVSQEEHTHRTGNRFSWFILLSHLSPGLTGGGARATGPLLKTGDLAANSSNIEVSRTVEQLVTARYWLPTRPAWRAPAAASTDPSDV